MIRPKALLLAAASAWVGLGATGASAQTIWNGTKWVNVTMTIDNGTVKTYVKLNSKSHSQDVRAVHWCTSNGSYQVGPWVGAVGSVSATQSCGPQGQFGSNVGIEW